MKEKFTKASNERLIRWINGAVAILKARGVNARFAM